MAKGIADIIMMIPKAGKFANSVVNKLHKAPKSWEQLKQAIKQIDDLLKKGKLKLDGKQTTTFESNKNILETHERTVGSVDVRIGGNTPNKRGEARWILNKLIERGDVALPAETAELWRINRIDPLKLFEEYLGLAATKKLPGIGEINSAKKYLKFLDEAKDISGKGIRDPDFQRETIFKEIGGEDLTKLSLGTINKKQHAIQKRIREIADNPNIKGTVDSGPKRDMIRAIADSERKGLDDARTIIKRKNAIKKYGNVFPRLDPENDAFIILYIDESGNAVKMSRFVGKFGAERHPITGELTRKEGTSFWDKWDLKKNKMREEGKEVWHETMDKEGKVIMSNPDYKLPTTGNMEISNEFYTKLSASDLAKKGYNLKDIDRIIKGREVRKYLDTQAKAEPKLGTYEKMHERTSTNLIDEIMDDLYLSGDDVYKMSIEEWIKKIPEYFAGGGQVPGFATGGVSNLFRKKFKKGTYRKRLQKDYESLTKGADWMRTAPPKWWLFPEYDPLGSRDDAITWFKERFMYGDLDAIPTPWEAIKESPELVKFKKWLKERKGHATGGISNLFRERQGYRDAGSVIKLAKGARWLIRMLKEMMDDMIFSREQFAKMTEALKMKYFKETEAAVKHLEAGGEIPENLLQTMRADARFKDLRVTGKDKDFIEMQEVVLGKPTKGTGEKIIEGTVVDDTIDLMAFKKTLPKDLLDKVNQVPVEKQTNLLRVMKRAYDAAKKGNIQSGVDVLQEQMLTDFIPKGKPHATGGRIGYATGGVSNLFRSR